MTFLNFPKPFISASRKTVVAYHGNNKASTLKITASWSFASKMRWLKYVAQTNNITLNKSVAPSRLINTVDMILRNHSSLSLWSTTYLTIPFWKPSVETVSAEDKKFRRLPTSAIPPGPTKIANTFEVISPVPIFNKTLTLLSEVTLNNGVFDMVLINFKRFVVKL